jgi:hypothetical protein
MESDWLALAEIQLNLYRKRDVLIQELMVELKEVDNDFTSPVQTWFDEDSITFRVTRVEDEVLRREEKREWFRSSIARIEKKTNYIETILSGLSDSERELVIRRAKDYSELAAYQRALKKFYRTFEDQHRTERNRWTQQHKLDLLRQNGLGESLYAKMLLEKNKDLGVV